MKKFTYLLMVAFFVTILYSCGRSGRSAPAAGSDEDSIHVAVADSAIVVDSAYYLTADSVGPIHIGQDISSLPVAVPNLFDNMIVTETPDAVAYSFLLSDIPQFTIYDFLNGKVDIIALEANSIGVQTLEGTLRVGDDFTNVLALPGVSAEWEALDEGGIWYWRYEGLFFGVDEMDINEELADALCYDRNPPRAHLFSSDVKIGYIATGLPF